MVHKKYTYKRGKKYGPYLYENKRVGSRVVTRYVGKPSLRWVYPTLLFLLLGIFIFFLFFFLNKPVSPTGKVSTDLEPTFALGEPLSGFMRFNIREGELIPQDSKIILEHGNQTKELFLSDVSVKAHLLSGPFYAEGTTLQGYGDGYGAPGKRETQPVIRFQIAISPKEAEVVPAEVEEEAIPHGEQEDSTQGSENASGEETDSPPLSEDEASESIMDEPTSETEEEVTVEEEQAVPETSDESEDNAAEKESHEPASEEPQSGESSPLTGNIIIEEAHTIDGNVQKDNIFVYRLEEGQHAELIPQSVMIGDTIVEDSLIKLKERDEEVEVSTDYEIIEEGFGEEFLGKNALSLKIDLAIFDLAVSDDDLTVTLAYNDTVLTSAHKEILLVGTSQNGTVIEGGTETALLFLREEIPLQRLMQDETKEIDLSTYFAGGERYTISDLENISTAIEGSILSLIPSQGYRGAQRAHVSAYLNDSRLDSNEFSILVSSGAVRVSTAHTPIVVGRPVRWVSNVTLEEASPAIIELPAQAGNISVVKVEAGAMEAAAAEVVGKPSPLSGMVTAEIQLRKKGTLLSFLQGILRTLTGHAVSEEGLEQSTQAEEVPEPVEVVLVDTATEYVIEYYTQAPQVIEESTSSGKEVTVYAPDELGYTNVLSYTTVPELVHVGQEDIIKIYWVEDNSYVPFDAYDLDEDGKLDYVEWIVPHLSNQTFQIILITKAEHLDSSRALLENVYEEVKARDGIWKAIPSGHYVRVVFEQNLSDHNDITLYARSNASGSVQVYERDKNVVVADFGTIGGDGKYTIYLSALEGSQDTFDLLVSGGVVEFDHIIDPTDGAPRIAFESPTPTNDSTQSASSIYVNVSTNDTSDYYAFLDFDKSLKLWMRMEDRDGAFITDLSTFGNTGLLEGYTIINTTSRFGNASWFNGSYDYIEVGDSASLDIAGPLTMAVWVYPRSGVNNGIIHKQDITDDQPDYGLLFGVGGDMRVGSRLNGGASDVSTTAGIPANTWTHIVSTYNLSTHRIYVNGVLNASANYTSAINTNFYSLFIGTYYSTDYTMNGGIDEVLIFNRSLSDNEILSLYNASANKYSQNFTSLSNGTHTIRAHASDYAGNRNQTELRTITIGSDVTAPLVTMVNPQNTTYTSLPITFNFSLNEAGSCNYSLSNGVTNISMTANASGSGFNAANTSIADGSYTARAYCWDSATNANLSRSVVFSVDRTPPAVTINYPSTVAAGTSVIFNVTLNENGNACNYTLNSGATNYTMQNNANRNFNASNASIADGSYTVRYYCWDSANNINASVTRAFTYINSIALSSCGTLSSAGSKYTLIQTVINQTGSCFIIDADNITFNGGGFSIDGDDSGSDYGILLSGRTNVTIKNITVSDFSEGIFLNGTNRSSIISSTLTSNTRSGILLVASNGNNITSNAEYENPEVGINFTMSSSNYLTANIISTSVGGFGIWSYLSNNNTYHRFVLSLVSDARPAVVFINSSFNNFTGQSVDDFIAENGDPGISLLYSHNNSFYEVSFQADNISFLFNESNFNTIIRSPFQSFAPSDSWYVLIQSHGTYIDHQDIGSDAPLYGSPLARIISSSNATIRRIAATGGYSQLAFITGNSDNITFSEQISEVYASLIVNGSERGLVTLYNSDIRPYDFANGSGPRLSVVNPTYGSITFLEPINGSGANLTLQALVIGNNSINITQTQSWFNRTANITFRGVNPYNGTYQFRYLRVLRNGALCETCVAYTELNASEIIVGVPGAGNYTIGRYAEDRIALVQGWNAFALIFDSDQEGNVSERNVSLAVGFNLVGYSSSNALAHSSLYFTNITTQRTWATAVTARAVQNQFAFWNTTAQRYAFTPLHDATLRANRAYWVYANQSGNLTIRGVGGAYMNQTFAWNRLRFSNASGTELNITDARTQGWIGRGAGEAAGLLIREWDTEVSDYAGVSTGGSLSSWKGYFIYANQNVTLIRRN